VTYEARSHYEFGDPVLEALARDEHTDHHRARARGQRLLGIADSLVSVLEATGRLDDPDAARGDIFHVLADALYGNDAIDIPDFTNARSLEALRRGLTMREDG
jgi:hypothetical protein